MEKIFQLIKQKQKITSNGECLPMLIISWSQKLAPKTWVSLIRCISNLTVLFLVALRIIYNLSISVKQGRMVHSSFDIVTGPASPHATLLGGVASRWWNSHFQEKLVVDHSNSSQGIKLEERAQDCFSNPGK